MTEDAKARYEILLKQTYLTDDEREELISLGMQAQHEAKHKEVARDIIDRQAEECVAGFEVSETAKKTLASMYKAGAAAMFLLSVRWIKENIGAKEAVDFLKQYPV